MAERIVQTLDEGRITLAHRETVGEAKRRPRCEEVMQRRLLTVAADESIQEAARKMRLGNVGFLPVCDAEHRVIGTLTDRDIAIRAVAANRRPAECLVREVMSADVVACRPDDDLDLAERYMAQYQKSRIVVTDDANHLQGVVSLADLALRESSSTAANLLAAIALREANQSDESEEEST